MEEAITVNDHEQTQHDAAIAQPFTRSQRIKIYVLATLAVLHVVVTVVAVVPGYLSIDEAYYHWMTKSFHDTGGLSLWNGYEEFPSPELVHPYVQLHRGRLFPPHPYLFPVLAAPFYHVAGFRGLFFANSLAFMGVVLFCLLTAIKLFRDRDLALNAALILVASTYAWEYSQAAWPHAAAVFFVSASFFLFACSYEARPGRGALCAAFGGGLIAGFGMGVRLDTVLVLPGLVLPFLFARPWRPKEAAMVLLGALPGASVLAMTNMAKFGSFRLFSYGQEGLHVYNRPVIPPYEILASAALMILFMWVITRSRWANVARRHRSALFLALSGGVLCALWALTGALTLLGKTAEYALVSLVDIRLLDPDIVFAPMTRSAGGGVLYMGAHKKALLQNLPFLTVLLIPLMRMARWDRDAPSLAMVSLVPVTIMCYFCYVFIQGEGGGGLCLNQRYLLPCLPFFCILTAYGVRELVSAYLEEPNCSESPWGRLRHLAAACGRRPLMVSAAASVLATAALYVLLTAADSPTVDQLEFPVLVMPLLLAVFLALSVVIALCADVAAYRPVHLAAWSLLMAALTWSTLVAFCYDFPAHRYARKASYDFAQKVLQAIPPDAVFFAGPGFFTASVALVERSRVRIAYPARDRFVDLPKLIAFHRGAGRPSFGVFLNEQWSALQAGPLRSCRITPVVMFDGFFVAEMVCP